MFCDNKPGVTSSPESTGLSRSITFRLWLLSSPKDQDRYIRAQNPQEGGWRLPGPPALEHLLDHHASHLGGFRGPGVPSRHSC